MQQVTRKKLGAGVNLTCITTPKFKRAVLRAMLVLPLGGEDAALRACLPQVLRLLFGIEDGHTRTLEEVGKEFNVTRERIRQI